MAQFITVGGNVGALHGWLADIPKQIRTAGSRALNDSAKAAQGDFRDKLPSIFHHVSARTKNSTFVRYSTAETLEGAVRLKDEAYKGASPAEYLAPQIEGGPRGLKRSEKRLKRMGLAPNGFYVPGKGATPALIAAVNARLGQLETRAQTQAANYRSKRKGPALHLNSGGRIKVGDFFLAHNKAGTPIGIYRLAGPGSVTPIMVFIRKAPVYKKRLDFYGLIEASAERRFGDFFDKRLGEVIAKSR